MNVRQVPAPSRWSLGNSQSLAILAHDPDVLAQRYGLVYAEGRDDLGCYQVAAIALEEPLHAWLVKHETDPNPGTVVYVAAQADIAHALALLLEILGLSREELDWVATG